MVLSYSLSLYKRRKNIYKSLVKTIVKESKELKWNIKEYQKTIYYNIILVKLILKRYIEV